MAEWGGRSGVTIVCDQLNAAGKAVLTKAIKRAGWQVEQFALAHPDDIPAGTRAVVAMGDEALYELTGWKGGKRAVKYTRGYLLPSYAGLPVIPTFDPGKVAMGQMKLLGLVMQDLGVAMQAAVGTRKVCINPKALVEYKVGLEALKDLYNEAASDPELLVAFDLETAKSWEEDEDESIEFSRDQEDEDSEEDVEDGHVVSVGSQPNSSGGKSRDALDIGRAGIRTVQFSLHPGTGISCDWGDECRDWVQRILSLPNPFAGHNCFHRHTSVLMADGSWKPIASIKKYDAVKTMTQDGRMVDDLVIDTSQISNDDPWVEVVVDGAYNRGVGRWGNRGVICTPDHKWFVVGENGVEKVRADKLVAGHAVLLPRQGLHPVISGSLLGDGHVSGSKLGRFSCGHTNEGWARAKADSFKVSLRKMKKTTGVSWSNGNSYWEFDAQIPHYWRDMYYLEDGRRKWIEPGPEALAIWYGDDGCLASKEKKNQTARFALHKYATNASELERIKEWFEKCFGKCSFQNGATLALSVVASAKFFELVAQYLHPSMEYKLPEAFKGQYNNWMEVVTPMLGKVTEVKEFVSPKKTNRTKFCLTVLNPMHCFFTRAGLVANSWLFDEPILRNHGITIKEGTHDTLWMWHHLQPDLPAHLQGVSSVYGFPFPWKHLSGSDLDFYGAADVDAVQRIMLGLPAALRRLGLWNGYERYVREFRPVLAAMECRGIPVSKGKLEELRIWLGIEVTRMDSELQPLIPSTLKGKKYWKTWPADTKLMVAEIKGEKIADIVNQLIRDNAKVTKKALNVVVKPSHFDDEQRKRLTDSFGYGWEGDLLYKELDFNPRSSQQILEYLKAKGYPIPKRFKDGVDTTSDKELERLEVKTKDEVLKLVRSIRAYSKMGNAYAGKLLEDGTIEGGWQPGPDGRLRATITFGPATGQLAARNPNVMTTPKRRRELANKFRECIVAEPGHQLVELDMRAFHARTLGLAARDAAYMKIADMDIHSFVAGHLVRFPGIETALTLPDADLKQLLGDIKKKYKDVRDFKAKPAILGIGFKMSKRRLYFECRESYESEREAGKLIDLLKALFPKVFAWQDAICLKADQDGKLINSWGACRWFWDVMRWTMKDGRWLQVTSRDAEKATAYLPSSNAHFMLRDKLQQANDKGWLESYGLINVIHDAVLFHCPTKLVEECVHNMKELLESPAMEMAHPEVAPNGFQCGAEAMVGPDWARMVEV